METCPGTQPCSRQGLYQPLSPTEYRVVHLLPGKFSHDIQCTLETRSTSVRASYEALSYQWGDETITKPIRITRLKAAPTVVESSLLDHFLRQRVMKYVSSPYRLLHRLDRDCPFPSYLILAFVIAFLFWRVTWPYIKPPSWAPLFIPKQVYGAVPSLVFAAGTSLFLRDSFRIVKEIVDTKLWRVWTLDFGWRSRKAVQALSDEMELFHITSNLEAALRHLRKENTARTLWIDALCINQLSESEKLVQVQRMDWIFANASSVLIWLGGYHDVSTGQRCDEYPSSCKHRAQIEAAFADARVARWWMIQPLLKWVVSWTRDEKFYQDSDAGLLDIVKRGWWRRLWVIQEVALATGHVRIQCGHSTCGYHLFSAGSTFMVLRHLENPEFLEDCSPSRDLKDVVDDFGYSLIANQNGGGTPVKSFNGTLEEGSLARGHVTREREFARRLGTILLRTSGRFNCRDDRDRLYAVLGIAGRALSGKNNKLASFVNTAGPLLTWAAVGHYFGWLAEAYYPREEFAKRISIAAVTLGAVTYEIRASRWTISRPDYAIGVSSHLIESVIGSPGDKVNRVELFTKLVQYLANQTKKLFFLDLANCGEDKDPAMPSWVPNWSRTLSESAYEYTKSQHILNRFSFDDGGKTIGLSGQHISIIAVCTPEDLESMESRPWYNALVKLAALPEESLRVMEPFLRKIQSTMEPEELDHLAEDQPMEALVYRVFLGALLQRVATTLRQSGTTIVHSASPKDNKRGEIGYLRTGTVAMGDDLVMVPGCFHHLVLRPQGQPAGDSPRWKLVGLVEIDVKSQGPGYSATEWKQLRDDGKLSKYVIE